MPGKRLIDCVSPEIRQRAGRAARLNRCLSQRLPPPLNAALSLVDLDAGGRAVVHACGGEWASQARLQQNQLRAILQSCGGGEVTAVVVKNRPLQQPRPKIHTAGRALSPATRDLIAAAARHIPDPRLAQSLRRLAQRGVARV